MPAICPVACPSRGPAAARASISPAATQSNAAMTGMLQLWALNPEQDGIAAMEDAVLHLVDCLSADGPQTPGRAGRRPTRATTSGNGSPEPRRTSRERASTAK